MTTLTSLATTSRGTPGLLISNFLSCQHARIRFHTLIDPKRACQKIQFFGLSMDTPHPDRTLCVSMGTSAEPHDHGEPILYAYTESSLLEDNKTSQATEICYRRSRPTKLHFYESAPRLAARVLRAHCLVPSTSTHSSFNSPGTLSIGPPRSPY
jgi:hypothetical protein